ncbi:hypothetical protein PYCC9005_002480 [Savitreella phatthalungensis]
MSLPEESTDDSEPPESPNKVRSSPIEKIFGGTGGRPIAHNHAITRPLFECSISALRLGSFGS